MRVTWHVYIIYGCDEAGLHVVCYTKIWLL